MVADLSFSKALALLSLVASSCQASILNSRNPSEHAIPAVELRPLMERARPNAPNGYAPQAGDCPTARPRLRSATGLSRNETAWLKLRRSETVDPMRDLLGRLNIADFDAQAYISNNAKNTTALPNVAIAFSGGGYRALLNGAGAFQAFDGREVNGTTDGHLGGLLQASTYVAGLSGGNWLVGSIFVNNFTTVNALQSAPSPGSPWEFENSIFEGPDAGGLQLLDTVQYFDHVDDAIDAKKDAGFNTSVTDYWGRALSFQLVNASEGGPSYTWSSVALDDDFANGRTPMPIVIADGRAPDEKLIPGNTTVYEFNPWELGSFDPTTYGFVPLEYLGSNFSGGILPEGQQCVRGFDNVGYVMGTSSSLFNQFLLQVNQSSIPDLAKRFINHILSDIGQDNNDIADYSPNPFYHYHNSTSLNAQSKRLTLVDGGEDFQNIPLHPLIQPVREVDVIFAIDSSADTDNYWPNGTSLVATYQRSLDDISNGTSFPAVPDQNTFVNLGLNTRPTFFGCDSSNTTSTTPLIVYLPNSPYVFHSNVSTFDPSYTTDERNNMILNGYAVATMGNATTDSTWPTCVGCAILQRSMERTGTKIPDACTSCFKSFCWDGTVNSTQPAAYDPPYTIGAVDTKASGVSMTGRPSSFFALLIGVAVTLLMII